MLYQYSNRSYVKSIDYFLYLHKDIFKLEDLSTNFELSVLKSSVCMPIIVESESDAVAQCRFHLNGIDQVFLIGNGEQCPKRPPLALPYQFILNASQHVCFVEDSKLSGYELADALVEACRVIGHKSGEPDQKPALVRIKSLNFRFNETYSTKSATVALTQHYSNGFHVFTAYLDGQEIFMFYFWMLKNF